MKSQRAVLKALFFACLGILPGRSFASTDRSCVGSLNAFLNVQMLMESAGGSRQGSRDIDALVDAEMREYVNNVALALEHDVNFCADADCTIATRAQAFVEADLTKNAPDKKNFFERVFGMKCLSTGGAPGTDLKDMAWAREQRKNALLNIGIAMTAMTVGIYEAKKSFQEVAKHPETLKPGTKLYPPLPQYANYALTIAGILSRTEIYCQNEILKRSGKILELEASQGAWLRTKVSQFKSNIKPVLIFNGLYIGGIVTTEALMGRDVTTREKAKEYAGKMASSLVWDMSFNAIGVIVLDDVYGIYLPLLAKNVNRYAAKAVGEAALPLLKLRVADVPGPVVDAGLRFGISAARNYGYSFYESAGVNFVDRLVDPASPADDPSKLLSAPLEIYHSGTNKMIQIFPWEPLRDRVNEPE